MWGLRLLGIAALAIEKLSKLDAAALGILRNSNIFLGRNQFLMLNHVTICTMPSFLLTKEMVCVGSLPVEAVEPIGRLDRSHCLALSGNPVTVQGAEVRRCGCHLSDLTKHS